MVGELQLRILSLKSLIVASLALEVLESPSWCIHKVFIHSKRTKSEEDIGLKVDQNV
jgi:hypothetical protein